MIDTERKRKLIHSIARLEAYQEIQNLMGRTMAAFNFRQAERVLENFALDQPSVWLEYADEGVFEGPAAVKAIVRDVLGAPPAPGEMLDLQLTTPMIEVAKDLKTAQAVWWCPGAGAIAHPDKDPEAIWVWGMIAADFIVTQADQGDPSHGFGGDWKIWHLHYFRFIKCLYDKGWVEDTSLINRLNTPLHPHAKPTTYHNPYSPLSIRDGIPACPRPYDTFTTSGWMLERDKTK